MSEKLTQDQINLLRLGVICKAQSDYIKQVSELTLQIKPLKLRTKFINLRGDLAGKMKDYAVKNKIGVDK